MASIIGLLVLFLATLTLGGCAGMPLGYGEAGGASGYAAPCPQPYGGGMPGYIAAAPPAVYVPQPLYAPQPYVYAPTPMAPQGPGPWIDHRERYQAARIRQGQRDGSLNPYEAQRLRAEQRHIRGAEARMSADGNLSPHERGRLNTMQNRANQDIYGARHNGMGQPGATGPRRGNGPVGPLHPTARRGASGPQQGNGSAGPMGSMRQPGVPAAHPGNAHAGPMNSATQPQINGAQTHRGTQPQARSRQPGITPKARGTAEATPGQ